MTDKLDEVRRLELINQHLVARLNEANLQIERLEKDWQRAQVLLKAIGEK